MLRQEETNSLEDTGASCKPWVRGVFGSQGHQESGATHSHIASLLVSLISVGHFRSLLASSLRHRTWQPPVVLITHVPWLPPEMRDWCESPREASEWPGLFAGLTSGSVSYGLGLGLNNKACPPGSYICILRTFPKLGRSGLWARWLLQLLSTAEDENRGPARLLHTLHPEVSFFPQNLGLRSTV